MSENARPPGVRQWLALAAVLLGVVMTSLDNTVVNVALPSISRDLHAGIAGSAWVVDAYLLSFAALLLTGGRLADTFGRRRVFLAGAMLLTSASLMAALAFNLEMLIGARALQGAGAALLTPPTLAIITHVFRNGPGRDLALGMWGSIGAIAFAVGPFVGGVLTQVLNWRWALLINVPPGVVAIVLARRFVPESRDPAAVRRLDVGGLCLAAIALLALTFALGRGHEYGWTSSAVAGSLLVAAVSAVGFVQLEKRTRMPLLDGSLLRGRFAAANLVTFAIGVAWFGAFLFTGLFLQHARGASPVQAAAALLPWVLMILVVAPLTGVLVRYVPARFVVVAGLVLLALAFLMLSSLDESSSYLSLVPGMLLGGAGAALTIPLNAIALDAAPAAKAGVASGIFNTARETGGCIGVALTSAIVSWGQRRSGSGGTPAHDFAAGYSDALLVAGSLTLGAALLTFVMLRPPARVVIPEPRTADAVSVSALADDELDRELELLVRATASPPAQFSVSE